MTTTELEKLAQQSLATNSLNWILHTAYRLMQEKPSLSEGEMTEIIIQSLANLGPGPDNSSKTKSYFLTATIDMEADGDRSDIDISEATALKEILRLIENGYKGGFDSNERESYRFNLQELY